MNPRFKELCSQSWLPTFFEPKMSHHWIEGNLADWKIVWDGDKIQSPDEECYLTPPKQLKNGCNEICNVIMTHFRKRKNLDIINVWHFGYFSMKMKGWKIRIYFRVHFSMNSVNSSLNAVSLKLFKLHSITSCANFLSPILSLSSFSLLFPPHPTNTQNFPYIKSKCEFLWPTSKHVLLTNFPSQRFALPSSISTSFPVLSFCIWKSIPLCYCIAIIWFLLFVRWWNRNYSDCWWKWTKMIR